MAEHSCGGEWQAQRNCQSSEARMSGHVSALHTADSRTAKSPSFTVKYLHWKQEEEEEEGKG